MRKLLFLCLFSLAFVLVPMKGEATTHVLDYREFKIVNAETLPLKRAASPKSETILTLQKGETVYIVGELKAGWLHVQYNDYEGYVNNRLLSDVIGRGIAHTLPATIAKITENNRVTTTDGELLPSFTKGQLVIVSPYRTTRDLVTPAALQTGKGIIHPAYLQQIPPTIRMTNSSAIVVKEKPSPSSKTILTLPRYMPFTSYGTVAGGWRIIQYGNITGYVNAAAAVAVAPTTKYVAAQGLPLYTMASRSAKVYNVLKQGTAVQAYSSAQGWTYVRIGSIGGYVPTNMLAAKKPAATTEKPLIGWQMDMQAIQPNILETHKLKDKAGKTVYVYRTTFGLGVRQEGQRSIYIQRAAGEGAAIAKTLSAEVNTLIVACDSTYLCQYIDGKLEAVIEGAANTFDAFLTLKHYAKGKLQLMRRQQDYDTGDTMFYTTYHWNDRSKRFEVVAELKRYATFATPPNEEKATWAEYERWLAEPSFIVE